jgi:uncharacterized protein YciI
MRRLRDEGRLVLGGPFLDEESGGLAVIEAGSLEEADALAREDPSIASGFLTVHVRPWLAAMRREEL